MMAGKVGKDGTIVIPVALRRRFGLEEGSPVIAEAREDGVLLRSGARESAAEERHRRLLDETNRAYAALRVDPDAWRDELAERAAWDVTLLDGLAPDECWAGEGERGATLDEPGGDPSARGGMAGGVGPDAGP